MSTYTLVLVDTTGIQSYIFGSNRLRENVGASHLVHLATEGWLRENPEALLNTGSHNLRNKKIIEELKIENGLDAELLYAGGGNTVLLLDEGIAQQFIRNLSRKLIEEAPGLDIVMVRQPVDMNGCLAQAINDGFKQLRKRKAERERTQPLLGLGVTAACQSTGMVANYEEIEPGENPQQRPLLISSEVKAKWDNNKEANKRLEEQFMAGLPAGYEFPYDFDQLGRSKGDFSYIAVVHADGNGMGKILQNIIKKYEPQSGAEANRKLINEVRKFSEAVNRTGTAALNAVVKEVADWSEARGLAEETDTRNKKSLEKLRIAIRPIVFGGDDVTFVCDGRIGLKAAQFFLQAFNRQTIPNEEGVQKAGIAAAGVAIVKTHYPFARAYELSETLCKNAKNTFARRASALDWHLAQSGLFGELREIRRREYDERDNEKGEVTSSLLMRPIVLEDNAIGTWRTWQNFSTLLTTFKDSEKWPRTKLMQLREAIRFGPEAVGAFVANYSTLPPITAIDAQHTNTGISGGRSVYFDSIEMIEQEVWQ